MGRRTQTGDAKMKETPIIMSTPMVQAILDNRKTQTRRVIKPQPEDYICGDALGQPIGYLDGDPSKVVKPRYQVGDKLWVRETWYEMNDGRMVYKADEKPYEITEDGLGVYSYRSWKPSIHMPKKYARIWLEITDVRVERVQDISHIDAISEGAEYMGDGKPKETPMTVPQIVFADYWDSINGKKYPWKSNPRVWVIEFKR